MLGTLSHEKEVNVAASEAWKLIGSLLLSKIAEKSLPNKFSKIVVLEGDGGVGTVIQMFYTDGTSYKEKLVVVDDLKRVKVAEAVEGAFLNLGFTSFRVRLEVIDKEEEEEEEEEEEWCLLKATIEYEVEKEASANAASLVSIEPMVTLLQVASDYLSSPTTNLPN